MGKWIEIKPIGYIGLVLFLIGMFADRVFNIQNANLKWALLLVAIVGFALALKGRKESGL